MTLPATLTPPDTQKHVWDVVVIGAGVAGSVAARQAGLAGYRVLLIDKRRFPRRKVCGACLNNVALEVFEQLGLTEVVNRLGGANLNQFSLHYRKQKLDVSLPGGLAVSREALDEALIREAILAQVEFLPDTVAKLGPDDSELRAIKLQHGSFETTIKTRCVIVASGLESVNSSGSSEWKTEVVAASRVGAGCLIDSSGEHFAAGTIWMAAGAGGYAGLVRVEGGRLNVAAAFDRDYLRTQGSPAQATRAILEQTRMPFPQELMSADWQGTLQLTRSTRPVASRRVFLIGDAAGYVEPFTGEGMAWALLTAQQVLPWVGRAISEAEWTPATGNGWIHEYRKLIEHRQNLCRRFAWFLRSPALISLSLSIGAICPRLVQNLVNRLNAAAHSHS